MRLPDNGIKKINDLKKDLHHARIIGGLIVLALIIVTALTILIITGSIISE